MSEITVVINAHREGGLARSSIKSALEAKDLASLEGVDCKIVAILDSSDSDTIAEFLDFEERIEIFHVNFADLATSRNFGIDQCGSKYLAFMDADDLWKSDWLIRAFKFSEAHGEPVVVHPELNIFFGEDVEVILHKSSELISKNLLAFRNPWTSASFGPLSIFSAIKYPPKHHERKIGFEDWGWNLRTLSAGYKHLVVPNTVHMIRRRRSSLSRTESVINCFPESCDFFKERGDL